MAHLTDIEIAQSCEMKPITEIAASAGIDEAMLEPYGKYKAKIDLSLPGDESRKNGKLVPPLPPGRERLLPPSDLLTVCAVSAKTPWWL